MKRSRSGPKILSIFVKAAITGGGYFINEATSVEEALTTVRAWEAEGIREPVYDGEMIAVELQGSIPAIVADCSWQDAHGHYYHSLTKRYPSHERTRIHCTIS